jgi:hypothetical protein
VLSVVQPATVLRVVKLRGYALLSVALYPVRRCMKDSRGLFFQAVIWLALMIRKSDSALQLVADCLIIPGI